MTLAVGVGYVVEMGQKGKGGEHGEEDKETKESKCSDEPGGGKALNVLPSNLQS